MDHTFFSSQAETIRREYRRIDRRWLHIQYRLMAALVGFTLLMELLMFPVFDHIGYLQSGMSRYMHHYVLAPLVANLILVGVATAFMGAKNLPVRAKMYGVSAAGVLIAFVIYTVHAVFPAFYLIFTFPIMLTVVYGEYALTLLVGLMAVVGKSVSDLFIIWDPARSSVFGSQGATADFAMSLILLLVCCALCLSLIATEQRKNRASIDLELERLQYWEEAMTDHLTKVWNRQALQEAFTAVDRKGVGDTCYYFAMLDIDHFKELNDTYGHQTGDEYLRALGETMKQVCGENAYPFRFGGDEFCILLWDRDEAGARALCDELRKEYAKAPVQEAYRQVTLSIGLTCMRPGERPNDLLGRADAALYHAKQVRDRVYVG